MSDEQKGLYSKNSCPWLLLFVFFLQFVTGEMLNMLWLKYKGVAAPTLLSLTCVQIFSVAIPCVIFIFLKNVSPKEIIKHRKLNIVSAFMCIVAGFFAQPIAGLVNSIIARPDTASVIPAPVGGTSFLLTLLVVVLLPAIFEEILMRGIVLHATEKYGYRASMLISALWFAILHNDIYSFLGTFFLGFICCYAVWMTQSVFSGMLIHFSFNLCGLIMQTTGFPNSTVSTVIFLIVSFVLFVPAISSLNRRLVRRYKTHGLFKQLFFAIFNLPMIIILLGFLMFHFVR